MKRNYKVLLLNADYTPMSVKSWQDAITMIYKDKVVQVDFYQDDYLVDGHNRHYPIPSVIALKKYIRRDYNKATFSKINLITRDRNTCQYCGNRFKSSDLTLDHVIPKSKWCGRGTSKCWTNIVSACFPCNRKKADRTCAESNMYPLVTPIHPSYSEIFFGLHVQGKIEKTWLTWLSIFSSFKNV